MIAFPQTVLVKEFCQFRSLFQRNFYVINKAVDHNHIFLVGLEFKKICFVKVFNFSIYGKVFKSFTPINCIPDIFLICLTVILNYTDIYCREWCADVNLTEYHVMVTFIKQSKITP